MEILIDFDGTVVTHEYPKIGKDIGAIPILKRLVSSGHKLILFTMRSNKELDEAVNWFKKNNIPLYGVQVNPTQHKWTDSPKAYGQLLIDDIALGAPLTYYYKGVQISERPFVNWKMIEKLLLNMKLI